MIFVQRKCPHSFALQDNLIVPGLHVVPNFLDESEEEDLVRRIDNTEWVLSQSGRRKQVCGSILRP